MPPLPDDGIQIMLENVLRFGGFDEQLLERPLTNKLVSPILPVAKSPAPFDTIILLAVSPSVLALTVFCVRVNWSNSCSSF